MSLAGNHMSSFSGRRGAGAGLQGLGTRAAVGAAVSAAPFRRGWNEAAGLGPMGEGRRQPVKTLLKNDRAGVGMHSGSKAKKVTHFTAFDAAAVKKRRRAGGKPTGGDGDGDGDIDGTDRTTVGASHMQSEQRREKRIKQLLGGPSYPGPNDA